MHRSTMFAMNFIFPSMQVQTAGLLAKKERKKRKKKKRNGRKWERKIERERERKKGW